MHERMDGIRIEQLVRYCTEAFMVDDRQVLQVYEELENLAYWIAGFCPENVLEIGTKGGTFFVLAKLATGKKACVDLVDVRPKIHNFMFGEDWRFFQGDSQAIETYQRVQAFCSSFDLIFIDGDHKYAGVKRDFELYRKLLSGRGVILFHDVDPDHVFKGGFGGDVYKFWEEIDHGSKTQLCTTRSMGRIEVARQRQHFGGIGIWRPDRSEE